MTTVRKIVTSKIDGDNANNTSGSEIRPRGELGVYENPDNGNLELLMFDGVRQNIRSKVLSKGIFYGGNADSGDGEGRDTIKLIPDTVLYRGSDDEFEGDYGDHRYLVIDPTGPDHIHIRAGGPMDQSNAVLILGGEQNNVSVSDDDKSVTITAENTLGSKTWMFDQAGHITFPDNTVQTTAYTGNNANVWVQDFETAAGAPADVPGMATSVEYLANGDIVALINHDTIASGSFNSVARFDSLGTKIWSMNFQGATTTDGWGMAVDNVNGFIYVAGVANDTETDTAILTKLSQLDGNVVWSKKYNVGDDNTNSVVDVASDGSPIVVGYTDNGTDSQIVTSKIEASTGAITWSRALNGQGGEQAYGMAVGPLNEVVTVGYMDQLGLIDAVATLYTEPASNPNWTQGAGITGGINVRVDFTDGVPTFTNIVDPQGGRTVDETIVTINGASFGGVTGVDDMIIKVGTLVANDTDDRMLVVKYDSDGAIQWQRAIQVDAGFACKGADADIDSEGNIYVCGNYVYEGPELFDDDNAMIIIKFNSLGVKQWTRKVVGDCDDFANSIVVGPDDCLYLSAITGNNNNSDYSMVIAKYNLDGTVAWQRLLDNTTTWTFNGGIWFGPQGSGSNLAVKTGYVAVAGGFGDPFGTVDHAIVAQFSDDGTVFAAGDYDFKAATFSGTLDSSASNITVVNAAKTDSNYAGEFTITDFDPDFDLNSDLIGTLYTQGSIGTINSIDNGQYSVSVGTDGVVTMVTSRGNLEFGALPEPGGPTHFHIMRPAGDNGTDLYFGDDYNYVLQRPSAYGGAPAYGVEIGANDNNGGAQQVWRFGTDGTTTFPENTIKNVANTSIKIGNPLVSGVVVATVDELVPPGDVWRLFIDSNIYPALGTTVHIGGTVTTAWGTPITATITDIQEDTNTDRWIILVAQDITAGFDAGPKTVSFAESYKTWTFGVNGNLTFSDDTVQTTAFTGTGAITFTGNEIEGNTFGGTGTIITKTVDNTGDNYSTGSGTIGFLNFGADGTIQNVKAGWTVTFASGVTRTVSQDAWQPLGTYWNISFDSGYNWSAGDVMPVTFSSSDYAAGTDPQVTLTAGTESWSFDNNGALTFPDGTVQTTAYPGITTVAKDGPASADVGVKGRAATVTASPSNNTNLVPGTYLGVTFNNFAVNVTVAENGDITATVTLSDPDVAVGDSGVFVAGQGPWGGTAPADNIIFTVATLTDILAPLAIDLTKTVNKLADGVYSLANGVEGQIMYLVRSPETISENVYVDVDNADGSSPLHPFRTNLGFTTVDNTGICTLIFTDGSWKQTGGNWD